MFKSLHMKLMLIMLLLITSLMAVVGAFLTTNVSSSRAVRMTSVFAIPPPAFLMSEPAIISAPT